MKLESLCCNHCGGPLSVPESANFVTCNHCGTQLAIRRTDSTTFTEELGEIRANQEQMMETLTRLERQNRLEQIDRDWEQERESYLTTSKNGKKSEPNAVGSLIGGIVIALFGFFWTLGVPYHAPAIFYFAGVLFMVLGIGGGIYGFVKAKDFREAHRQYMRRRSEALRDSKPDDVQFSAFGESARPEQFLDQLGRDENA